METHQKWLFDSLKLLSGRYGNDGVIINGNNWREIFIYRYQLPQNWSHNYTKLLIILPSGSQMLHSPPDRFYISKGLKTRRGDTLTHYFEDGGYNDLSNLGYARYSFHLQEGWHPSLDCARGTNLLHIINGLYKGMYAAAKEATQ